MSKLISRIQLYIVCDYNNTVIGTMLGAHSRRRTLPLSLVARSASCNNKEE